MFFWLGFVLPTMASITVELYIVIPLRHFMEPGFTPTIHIFESWATGLIIAKIIIRTYRPRQGGGRAMAGLEAVSSVLKI
jgi:E3 ubiquitin-protein ligase MARCH6